MKLIDFYKILLIIILIVILINITIKCYEQFQTTSTSIPMTTSCNIYNIDQQKHDKLMNNLNSSTVFNINI